MDKTRIDLTIKDASGRVTKHTVDVDENSAMKCPKCSGVVFQEGFTVFKVSHLLVGTPTDLNPKVPVMFCVKCYEKINHPEMQVVNKFPQNQNVVPIRP